MQVTLNHQQIETLERILSYMHDNEEKHYEEYLTENGSGEGHILSAVTELENYIDKNLVS